MNIQDMIEFLFPNGTQSNENFNFGKSVENCPSWPSDTFAFTATIMEKAVLLNPKKFTRRKSISSVASEWKDNFSPPSEIKRSWSYIYKKRLTAIDQIYRDEKLVSEIHFLFTCSDEASAGLGWGLDFQDSVFSGLLFPKLMKIDNLQAITSQKLECLRPPYFPFSLCYAIPPQRAVVTPKSICPSVGFSIRSLSHHLALHEAQPKLKISWNSLQNVESLSPENFLLSDETRFNALFIPYPFEMKATAIRPRCPPKASKKNIKKFGYFELDPSWIPGFGKEQPCEIAKNIYNDLVKPLLLESRRHYKKIDCVIFPECSLTEEVSYELARILARDEYINGLRILISGVISSVPNKIPKNKAMSYFLVDNEEFFQYEHSKHHRWKLDVAQTQRYNFSSFPADSNVDWWEHIDVAERHLPFYTIQRDACIAVLVCEDLARNDPALPAVRAIGPNLVIALLMDGPQLTTRWPARYATVLADDPGSAILSVTSAAMVDRSNRQETNGVRSVALWKHHTGKTQHLILPDRHHGFLLSLAAMQSQQVTMDNRTDDNAVRFELMGAEPLKISNPAQWLG
ncbi:hypothetical protein [Chromobacterium phragmitis]|uniref:hypothetical protein n=1 Tax=Chromobacterium phragmitis TaxID=2202141 RepID=UPI0011AEA894|nr:hypothetical protein [Chromobacterium phragmitis]